MQNYFEIFGITPGLEINTADLEQKYFELQRQFHPDKFVAAPLTERIAALQKSTDINQAYEVLKNYLSRAIYILELGGIKVFEEEKTLKTDQDFLEEMLDIREKLLEAETAAEVNNFIHLTEENILKQKQILGVQITENQLKPAAQTIIKLNYHDKFLVEARIKLCSFK